MSNEKKPHRFKEGDFVRVTFVAEVLDTWHGIDGKPLYAVHIGTITEECLEPWEEDDEREETAEPS